MRVIRATDLKPCEKPPARVQFEMRDTVRLTIADVPFEFSTNVDGLADAFAMRYSDHLDERTAAFAYYVLRDDTGYVFWCAHAPAWRWDGALPLDAVLFLADAAAVSALIQFDNALASMHAAGIWCNGSAAAIVADSEGGKTTTAIACAAARLPVYSDERVLLRGDVVHPFWRRCRLRAGGAKLLNMDVEREVSWRELFGERVLAKPAPLRTLFVITGRAAEPHIEPMQTAAALRAAGRWFDCSGTPLERMARALQAVRHAHCFALTLGDPHETAYAIRAALTPKVIA
jgi:hypothetical protein